METVLKVLQWLIDNHVSLLSLCTVLYGLLEYFKGAKDSHKLETKKQKLKALQEVIPYIIRVIDDLADLSGNEKPEAFIEKVKAAMLALGFELLPEDLEGIKLMGSGAHKMEQDWNKTKELRI